MIQINSVTMPFHVEKFVSHPIIEKLNLLKKTELFQLVQHYKLMAGVSFNKSKVKEVVLKYLIDKDIIPPMEEPSETATSEGIMGEELLQFKD